MTFIYIHAFDHIIKLTSAMILPTAIPKEATNTYSSVLESLPTTPETIPVPQTIHINVNMASTSKQRPLANDRYAASRITSKIKQKKDFFRTSEKTKSSILSEKAKKKKKIFMSRNVKPTYQTVKITPKQTAGQPSTPTVLLAAVNLSIRSSATPEITRPPSTARATTHNPDPFASASTSLLQNIVELFRRHAVKPWPRQTHPQGVRRTQRPPWSMVRSEEDLLKMFPPQMRGQLLQTLNGSTSIIALRYQNPAVKPKEQYSSDDPSRPIAIKNKGLVEAKTDKDAKGKKTPIQVSPRPHPSVTTSIYPAPMHRDKTIGRSMSTEALKYSTPNSSIITIKTKQTTSMKESVKQSDRQTLFRNRNNHFSKESSTIKTTRHSGSTTNHRINKAKKRQTTINHIINQAKTRQTTTNHRINQAKERQTTTPQPTGKSKASSVTVKHRSKSTTARESNFSTTETSFNPYGKDSHSKNNNVQKETTDPIVVNSQHHPLSEHGISISASMTKFHLPSWTRFRDHQTTPTLILTSPTDTSSNPLRVKDIYVNLLHTKTFDKPLHVMGTSVNPLHVTGTSVNPLHTTGRWSSLETVARALSQGFSTTRLAYDDLEQQLMAQEKSVTGELDALTSTTGEKKR